MNSFFLLITFVLFSMLINSCENTSSSSADDKGFDGHWRVSMAGNSLDISIETGSGYMYFSGTKYKGSGSDTYFSGDNTVSSNGYTTKYSLSISRSGDNISGSLTARITINGKSSQNTENFSGYRIDD